MYCECGCGQRSKLSEKTSRRDGTLRGKPLRFIHGHNSKVEGKHPHWKGGRTINNGYVYIFKPEHPNCDGKGYVSEHRLVCEKAQSRYLNPLEIVHHLDRVKSNNEPYNLLVCSNQRAHMELHASEDAFRACGRSDYRWCPYCKTYDAPENLTKRKSGHGTYHKNCVSKNKR